MTTCQRKLLAVCSLLLLSAPACPVQAVEVYALASNNIRDFRISGDTVLFPNIFVSATTATQDGVVDSSGFGLGIIDAQISQLGSALANNARLAGGVNSSTGRTADNYSYADALISHAPGVGHPFQAQAVAESNLRRAGYASGTVRNESTLVFTVEGGKSLDLSFTANPWIKTFRDDQLGLIASGALKTTIEIRCASTLGCGTTAGGQAILDKEVVFRWAPDGLLAGLGAAVGGTLGGTELSDAENLNAVISNILNVSGPGAMNFSDNAGQFGLYQVTTGVLGKGRYILDLHMSTTDNIASVATAVPEPGHWSMVLLGLTVLFLYRARREEGLDRL